MNPIAFEAALAMSSEKVAMSLQKKDLRGLKKGDIILTSFDPEADRKRDPGLMSRVFGNATRQLQGGYTHSAIYAGGGDIVEAEAQGINAVVRRPLSTIMKERDGAVAIRLKVPKKVRVRALEYAERQIGKPYADRNRTLVRQGVALLSKKLTPLMDTADTPEERQRFTCGNLLTAAFEAQGHKVNDDERSWFLGVPADFLSSRKGKVVKVIGKVDRHKPLLGRIKKIDRATAKLAEDFNPYRRKINVTNALMTAGALGGAAWGLSRKGRFDATWMNPAWKGQFGIKPRLAQGMMGAGTGAAVALPVQLATQPLVDRVQPTYDKSKAMVQNRALPGWGG